MRRLFLKVLFTLQAVCLGCGGSPLDVNLPKAERHSSITNGSKDYGHAAVGIVSQGLSLCSGVLIGSQTVLTACHCLMGQGEVEFELGGYKVKVPKNNVHIHPQCLLTMLNIDTNSTHDIGLLNLPTPVWGVKPAPLSTRPPFNGQSITVVGFGRTNAHSADSGIKRKGEAKVSTILSQQFLYLGGMATYSAGVCHGDSGGASFSRLSSGEEVVVGIHAFTGKLGGESTYYECGPDNGDMRVDAYHYWIAEASLENALFATGPLKGAPLPPAKSRLEGEPCESANLCQAGLVCVDAGAGPYCMEQCAKSACEGGEVCSVIGGSEVCFLSSGLADDGYTNPDHINRGGPGSCESRCGQYSFVPGSNPPCRCDTLCVLKKDCCPDYQAVCKGKGADDLTPSEPAPSEPPPPPSSGPSCKDHCHQPSPVPLSSPKCYCDSICSVKGDCCPDYHAICGP